ncbi:MAG TPA: hypothetical protein VK444_04430 [Methanobacteriaceae archaeon]|nr:hypothetical protein [Methanobacteriaceae archaeon]
MIEEIHELAEKSRERGKREEEINKLKHEMDEKHKILGFFYWK